MPTSDRNHRVVPLTSRPLVPGRRAFPFCHARTAGRADSFRAGASDKITPFPTLRPCRAPGFRGRCKVAMQTCLFRSIATHLAGVAAGGALAWVLVAEPRQKEELPPPKHRPTTLAARFSPTVTLELERIMEEVAADRQEDQAARSGTLQERNLRRVEHQRLDRLQNEKDLARLRSIGSTFAGTANLGPVLTEALAAGDHDLSRALFVEWHRRNPDAAFDALARRNAWLDSMDGVLAPAIPADQLIAQIAREDRPETFRDHLALQLGAELARSDNLRGLISALDGITAHREALLRGFTESWVPDDGGEAARFVGLEMKPEHQRILLEALAGPRFLSTPLPWTVAFADSLFSYDLHVSQVVYHDLRTQAEELHRHTGIPAIPSAAPITSDMDSDAAIAVMMHALDGVLHRERDYPELLAAGEIDFDEVLPVAEAGIPGASRFPDALRRALFLKLAPHHPARAITWANSSVPPARLDQDILRLFEDALGPRPFPTTGSAEEVSVWSRGYEPRTRRIANLAAILHPAHIPDAEDFPVFVHLRRRLESWSQMAPDSARASLNRIHPDHPARNTRHLETAGP